MTNEEKAMKIANEYSYWDDRDESGAVKVAIEMAEWKDQQFEEQKAELIDKAWKVFEKYATYMHPRKGEEVCKMTKYKFLKAMEEQK